MIDVDCNEFKWYSDTRVLVGTLFIILPVLYNLNCFTYVNDLCG